LAAAALILFLPAIFMPVLRINKLGHSTEDSIVSGVAALLSGGHFVIAFVVLVFSLVVPPLKLLALIYLATGAAGFGDSHKAWTHRLVELLGRWGMLDVLVVAVLVAYVKLGDAVSIAPGPGLVAFAGCVLLSLLASVCFPPHTLWKEQE
jgi:paraquat-inducible protein A